MGESKSMETVKPGKSTETFTGALFEYVRHKSDCDWLQPMWHQGPCDCGLTDLIRRLPEELLESLTEASAQVRETVNELTRQQNKPERP